MDRAEVEKKVAEIKERLGRSSGLRPFAADQSPEFLISLFAEAKSDIKFLLDRLADSELRRAEARELLKEFSAPKVEDRLGMAHSIEDTIRWIANFETKVAAYLKEESRHE